MVRDQRTDATPAKLRRLFIQRREAVVTFTIHCQSEYDAMQMYDRAIAAAKTGRVNLDVVTQGEPIIYGN